MHWGYEIAFTGIGLILSEKYINFNFQQILYYVNHENEINFCDMRRDGDVIILLQTFR